MHPIFPKKGFLKKDRMKTLFLDRDGVVNVQIVGGYVETIGQFVFADGFLEAMKLLRPKFRHIILVTNQQCIGKGICTRKQVDDIHNYLQQRLSAQNTPLDAVYCCPHLAAEHCSCRKPAIGMALMAKRDFPDIDFSDSIMLGDSLSDMQFAVNAGIMPVHIGKVSLPEHELARTLAVSHFDTILDFARQ